MTKRILLLLLVAVFAASAVDHEVRAASPASAAPVPTVATVHGVVKFEGTLPKATRINMSADSSCSKLHPGGVMPDDLVEDENGGLENVIVFVSQGLEGRTFEQPAQPVVIEQKGCMYVPHVVAMRANQTLEVVNSDKTVHNIHPMPSNNREWNKAQPPGTPLEETFTREEIAIPVRCNVHPWMRSYIAVFKHPYFSVTGRGGSFDLKALPPGTYTLEAWHEKLGTATQKVNIEANQTKSIEFVFKSHR